MQLARVAARADRGVVQLHREAWPITAYYWLYTRYAPRVLHFSAFHFSSYKSRTRVGATASDSTEAKNLTKSGFSERINFPDVVKQCLSPRQRIFASHWHSALYVRSRCRSKDGRTKKRSKNGKFPFTP